MFCTIGTLKPLSGVCLCVSVRQMCVYVLSASVHLCAFKAVGLLMGGLHDEVGLTVLQIDSRKADKMLILVILCLLLP